MRKFAADTLYRINKELYYRLRYFLVRGRWARFSAPRDLSEYLLSEMLKPDFKKYADYADKIKVRDYVAGKGLAGILPQVYGVWDNADEIDFDTLPDTFVLKTNHGCGNHIFCKAKKNLDIPAIRKKINKLLSKKNLPREPHYSHISPQVYAEELICDNDAANALPIDYKFLCSKGEPLGILVCVDRDEKHLHSRLCIFDTEWRPLNWLQKNKSERIVPAPPHLKEMTEIARTLSADFDFVRVDLYDTGKQVFFGELTFTPHAGFMTNFNQDSLDYLAVPLLKNDK